MGARRHDGEKGSNSGHVRVFKYNDEENSWSQIGSNIEGDASEDYTANNKGLSLSKDGMTLVVNAPFSDRSFANAGLVRVYHYDGSIGNKLDLITQVPMPLNLLVHWMYPLMEQN